MMLQACVDCRRRRVCVDARARVCICLMCLRFCVLPVDVTDRFWDQARRIGFDDSLEPHDKLDSDRSTESP